MERRVIDGIPGSLHIYEDGTVERFGVTMVDPGPCCVHGVTSKDVTVDAKTGVRARVFIPTALLSSSSSSLVVSPLAMKVPVVLYFHGGGWCLRSPFSNEFHGLCCRLAAKSGYIWVSVAYRLAPEHKLPAAYDDCFAALCWLRSIASVANASDFGNVSDAANNGNIVNSASAADSTNVADATDLAIVTSTTDYDPWLASHGDFSNCFLVGESAGALNVHQVAVRDADMPPLTPIPLLIRAMVLLHPAVLQARPVEKPEMESRLTNKTGDVFTRLALPENASYGHPLVNPPPRPDLVGRLPPALVAVAEHDILCDNGLAYYHSMLASGHQAQLHVTALQGHTFFLRNPTAHATLQLESHVIKFLASHAAAPAHGHVAVLIQPATPPEAEESKKEVVPQYPSSICLEVEVGSS